MINKESNLRHNCCKECNFEWKSIDVTGNTPDKLVCKVCKREFVDTIVVRLLKEKIREDVITHPNNHIDKIFGDDLK